MAHGQSPAGEPGQAAPPPGQPTAAGIPGPGRPVRVPLAAPGLSARLVLAAALLAVVLAGTRAAVPATHWDDGPWHDRGTPLGIGLELVLVALLAAVELRRRRHPYAGQPAAGLRALLRVVLVIGVVAIPVLMVINAVGKLRPHGVHQPTPPAKLRLPTPSPHVTATHSSGFDVTLVLYAVLAAALLAAIVICVLLLRRRARGAWDDSGEVIDAGDEEQLRRAVRSGQAALREVDDARLAIIACYAAMEASLARAGAVRGDAETPDELLSRAAAAGLAHGGEAARLTELFYEARFSTHPLPPERRDEARHALEVLAVRLPASASAGSPSTGTGTGTGNAGSGNAGTGTAP